MPLDTSVKHYTNFMTGAPTLNNAANTLIPILDAVLVNGFGDQTLTSLSVTNNVATATVSSGYVVGAYSVVTIAGATPSGLNGDKKVLSSTPTSFTFDATGIPNGAATGTITARFPGAGWTKEFSGVNKAVYRNNPSTGTGFRIRVDDSGITSARFLGYESMSSVDTGTNPFPNETQLSGGLFWPKANNASLARRWWIVADSKTCYFSCSTRSDKPTQYSQTVAFGDFKTNRVGDTYNFFIVGAHSDTSDSLQPDIWYLINNTNSGTANRWLARGYTLVAFPKLYSNFWLGRDLNHSGGNTGIPYPNLTDNSLILVKPNMLENGGIFRGEYRGLYYTPQDIRPGLNYFQHDDIIPNSPTAGKAVIYKTMASFYGDGAAFFIDVAGPWD